MRHPHYFLSRSKIFLVNEKSVRENSWIVGPTSECFRQRSVHDDSWRLFYILTAGNVFKYIVGHFKLM